MKRRLLIAGIILALIASAVLVLRSAWAAQRIRQEIVSRIEHATGARASLENFDFSWHRLTAGLYGLTLHGTEPADGPPLFHAASIQIALQPGRILSGTLRISQLTAQSPALYILQRTDGSTNIPALQSTSRTGISEIVRFRIGQLTIRQGSVQINDLRLPCYVDARDIALQAQYRRSSRSYDLNVSAKRTSFQLANSSQSAASLELTGQLNQHQLAIASLKTRFGGSAISATGFVRDFARPNIDLNLNADVDARDVANLAGLRWLVNGSVAVKGTAHYDRTAGPSFAGFAEGNRLAYKRSGVIVENASFHSHLLATPDLISASGLRLNALGGFVDGELTFENLRQMTFRGSATNLDARSVLALVIPSPLPFTTGASGPVTLDARIGRTLTNTVITTSVNLASEGGPGGRVSLDYHQDGNRIEFGPSDVTFPHSQVKFSGQLNSALQLDASTSSLAELKPTLDWLGLAVPHEIHLESPSSTATFLGEIDGPLDSPTVNGNLQSRGLIAFDKRWDSVAIDFKACGTRLQVSHLSATYKTDQLRLSGSATLRDWRIDQTSQLSVQGALRTTDFASLAQNVSPGVLKGGAGSITANISGTPNSLMGSTTAALKDIRIYDQTFTLVQAAVTLSGDRAIVKAAQLKSGNAAATVQAEYSHAPQTWALGQLHLRADSNRFPVQTINELRKRIEGFTAQAEVHGTGDFQVHPDRLDPVAINGRLSLRDIAVGNLQRGDMTFDAGTQGDLLTLGVAGNLDGSPVLGNLRADLVGDEEASGQLHFGGLTLATIRALVPTRGLATGWEGSFSGMYTFHGPLRNWRKINSRLVIDEERLRPTAPLPGGVPGGTFVIANTQPIVIEGAGAIANLRQARFTTRDGEVSLAGTVDVASGELGLEANGSVDLRVAQLFQPRLQAAGAATLSIGINGPPDRPRIRGTVTIANASLVLPDLTNTLTGINGTIRFDSTRAIVEGMTAQTGGGTVQVTGAASFGEAGPVSYNLDAQASKVRFRYLGASVTGDATLRMTGTTQNGLISGDVTISRVVLEPGADLASVFANAAIPVATPVNQQEFLTGLGWDIHIQSAPDLQVVTSLSQDVQANIDLHLRGTRDHPVVLGQITANQGEVNVFGTRYTISRGTVSFINPVRIDPVLDLDLQTETRGITVDVIVTGTMNKLSMNYRSDPPLQAKEILALLTVGQAPTFAPESSNSRIQADTSALQAGAETVLGQAISPTSNRLSRFFGVTNVKLDPFIENEYNNRQARLTLEEQISRSITVTYITNLAQTSEQIFRFEWSFNPQYSLVAVRDDNGEFGIDIQYRKRFK